MSAAPSEPRQRAVMATDSEWERVRKAAAAAGTVAQSEQRAAPGEAPALAQDTTGSVDAVRKQPPSKAVPLIAAAMRAHGDDWVPLSVIGSHVRAANPEFDPRTYGCAKLADLLEKTGQFQVKRNEVPVRARMKRLQ